MWVYRTVCLNTKWKYMDRGKTVAEAVGCYVVYGIATAWIVTTGHVRDGCSHEPPCKASMADGVPWGARVER